MNKTLSIGLAGFSFIIEEHAYIKLSDYLAALRSSLDPTEADEVMHDIEIRMVEIFKDTLQKREVINDADVEKVIALIGTPEKIEEQEEAYYSENNSKKSQKTTGNFSNNGQKQLFRDPEKQKIAGVCAGLAYYTGLDINTMRIIWVAVAILGTFSAHISTMLLILVYIILWIVLPKAETASDFLKMKGKPMNFDNLKSESNKLVQFANESTQRVGEIYNENKPYINKTGSGIWNVLKYLVGIICALFAIGSILGIFAIFGLFGGSEINGLNDFNFKYGDGNLTQTLTIIMILGTLIPAVIFGLLSIKIFSPKTKLRNLGWIVGGLFLLLLGVGTYFGVNMAKKEMFYRGHKEDTEEISIASNSDTLYVDKKQITIPQSFTAYDDDVYSDKKLVYEGNYPDIEVVRKEDVKTPYLIIKKEGEGYNIPISVEVPVTVENNKILFPNFIRYPFEHRLRDYHVYYELVVPKKMTVLAIDKDRLNLNDDDSNDHNNNDDNEDDQNGVTIKTDTNSIILPSNSTDSIIINGKKVGKNEAELMIKKLKPNLDSLQDLNINIKNGKKEISIKTK